MATLARPRSPTLSLPESVVVAFALALAYCGASVIAPLLFRGGWNLYVVQPAIWLGLAYWCLYARPEARAPKGVLALAGAAALFHVAILVIAGLLLGFGRSPYAHSLLAIGGNLVYLGAFLAGLEAARWRLLKAIPSGTLPPLLLVTLLFAVVDVPLGQWRGVWAGEAGGVSLSSQMLLPSVGESWLATVLALAGGPYAALAYRGVLAAVEWLSPILPALGGVQVAVLGVIAPVAAALAVKPAAAAEEAATPEAPRRNVPAWMLTAGVMVVALIWLNTGLLGVQPAVVTGISMQPALTQGDIVVTRPVSPQRLQVGDLIRFQEGGVPVIHRIREVRSIAGDLVFVTQGDNNDFADAPVLSSAVEGRVILTIPKLGSIPIEARRLLGR